jgi:hypothetical protein
LLPRQPVRTATGSDTHSTGETRPNRGGPPMRADRLAVTLFFVVGVGRVIIIHLNIRLGVYSLFLTILS